MPTDALAVGGGEGEAGRRIWLSSAHLTASRALECFLRKTAEAKGPGGNAGLG